MEAAHAQEFRIRDLPTRSVTLFPTRAQVVRDIQNVILKPGLNQISIVGLTPTVDEHSIKVEGTGSAVISDISVELLENSEVFQEIYPDSDDDDSAGSESEGAEGGSAGDSDDDALAPAKTELKEVQDKIVAVLDETKRADEVVLSAEKRLSLLDEYGKKFEPKSGADIGEIVDVYTEQRGKTFQDHIDGTIRKRELERELSRLRKKENKLSVQVAKEQARRNKASAKRKEAQRKKDEIVSARKQKKAAEKARLRREKHKFWPRSCYTVRITLDATHYTPVSSRRSSVSSVTDLVKPVVDGAGDAALPDTEAPASGCDISISYVTSAAYWSPSYDLQLNTTASTGTLFFDAQLTNNTSEAWRDCKIILSTSQAVFAGLQDDIPKLVPWRIKLGGRFVGGTESHITKSTHEVEQWRKYQGASASASRDKHGADLIGLWPGPFAANVLRGSEMAQQQAQMQRQSRLQQQAQHQAIVQQQAAMQQAAMQQPMMRPAVSNSTGGGLFGSPAVPAPAARTGAFGTTAFSSSAPAVPAPPAPSAPSLFGSGRDSSGFAADAETLLEPKPEPSLDFQESAMEETGLTTTFDLPGTKTLAPSSTASKQRVARILFSGVAFSHTVVAKYRPAAFLKARLRNSSKMSLLRGPVGLTLDGTFMGRSALPRCSSGDSFTMSLGVDPTIRVSYPKPDVKRSSTGVFSKEHSLAYRRSVTITNTRGAAAAAAAAKPVRLVVSDQVPVSEDDKLRVEMALPRGLAEGGAGVSAGVQEGGAGAGGWGRATAALKKGGEVSWDVELNAGRSVKLDLEYEVSFPAGEVAVQSADSSQ